MKRTVVIAILGFGLVVGCGPPIENQGKWAAAACESHKGIITFDDFDSEGSGEGDANVVCGDGTHWVQIERTEDCPGDDSFCWETPAEVRKRAER